MKVLAICAFAPPELTPQAIQIGRQLYHLDAEVTLLHRPAPASPQRFDQYPDFFERVRPLPVADPGPLLSGLWHRAALRALPGYGDCPDGYTRWAGRATEAAQAAARESDVIASFGMPMSDHLVGRALKRRTGRPWLAHFSDPWLNNPFHQRGWWSQQRNAQQERSVLAEADQIVFTSQRTLDHVMSQHPGAWRSKARVLPHAWDDAAAAPSALAPSTDPTTDPITDPKGPLVIRHIGSLYGARSPLALYRALATLWQQQPALLAGVRFEFYGYMSPDYTSAEALAGLPPGLVQCLGMVGYLDGLSLSASADALLVIDAPSATPSIFLPSKLVESIGANRPVWGITPPGTSAEVISEWCPGATVLATAGDVAAVTRLVESGLRELRAGTVKVSARVRERYAAPAVAAALRVALQRAIGA
ncbi:MAG: hypothetical protein RJA98_1509 [Pseudomonadota bacterium]